MEIEATPETRGQKLLKRVILEKGETIEEDIICQLCKGIVVDPKSCANCESYFCDLCIQNYLKTSDNCSCGSLFECLMPHKIFQRVIGKHRFECENKDKGCRGIFPYKQMLEHEDNCSYVMVECPNQICTTVLLKHDIDKHLLECMYRQDKCEYCKNTFLYCDLIHHYNNCEKKPSKCEGCHKSMFQAEYAKHYAACEEVEEKCDECNTMIKRKNKTKHDKVSCIYEKFIKTKENISKEISESQRLIAYLKKRIDDQEAFFGNKCTICNKFACEVSKKNCECCKKIFCIPCSRKNMRNCKNCESVNCQRCFSNQDVCVECQKKKTKTGNSKGKAVVNI